MQGYFFITPLFPFGSNPLKIFSKTLSLDRKIALFYNLLFFVKSDVTNNLLIQQLKLLHLSKLETLIPGNDGWLSCTICSTLFINASESLSSVLRPLLLCDKVHNTLAVFLFDFDNIRGFVLGDPVASKSRKLPSWDFGNRRDLFVLADDASQKSPGKK